jgi:Rap1a immunity proteins
MTMRNLLLGLAILLASVGVAAANKTGDELLNECKGAGPYAQTDIFLCVGYIDAIFDLLALEKRLCWRGGAVITVGEAVDVTRNYLIAHPETRHFRAIGLVQAALQAHFPCSGKGVP